MEFAQVAVGGRPETPHGATNVYVLGRENALLVDPAARQAELDRLLAARDVGHVAVTHHHADHVGAVAHYASEYDAIVWCRTGRERAFEAAAGVSPDRTFANGTVVPTGSGPVDVLDTPGHAPEHVAFEFGGGILVGDLAVETGSVAVGAPEGDVRAYLSSLRRMYGRDPETLYPGHGPFIDDPRRTLERLVDHRNRRERRILAAVRRGAGTVDEILTEAYDKNIADVREMAAATVRAHLEKLAVEGKIVCAGDRVEPD